MLHRGNQHLQFATPPDKHARKCSQSLIILPYTPDNQNINGVTVSSHRSAPEVTHKAQDQRQRETAWAALLHPARPEAQSPKFGSYDGEISSLGHQGPFPRLSLLC